MRDNPACRQATWPNLTNLWDFAQICGLPRTDFHCPNRPEFIEEYVFSGQLDDRSSPLEDIKKYTAEEQDGKF